MNTKKLILTGFIALFSVLGSMASTPSMSGSNVTGEQGATATLDVKLTNSSPLRDFQMNLSLPEGISIATDSKDNFVINVNKDLAPYHTGIANYHEGLYKMVVSSTQDAPIVSDGEVLVSIPLVLDAPVGTYTYTFSTVYASQDIDGIVSNVSIPNFSGKINIETPVVVEDFQFYSKKIIVEADASTAVLGIGFKNSAAVKAFLFDIEFPEGIAPIFNDEAGDYVEYGDRIPSRFDVFSELDGQTLNVDGATTRNTSVAAGDDVLLTIELALSVAPGTYPIKYANQSVTLSDGSDIEVAEFIGYLVVEGKESVNKITFTSGALTPSTPTNTVAMDNGEYVANEINLLDANPLSFNQAFVANRVVYTREFVYDVWQPLYLPYDMAYEDWADKGEVAEFTSVNISDTGERSLHWRSVTEGKLKANHPYIFKPANTGEVVFTSENSQFTPTSEADVVEYTTSGETYTLTGVYEEKTDMRTSGALGMAPDGCFKHVTSDAVVLRPFRIYLLIDGPAIMNVPKIKNYIDGYSSSAIEGIEIEVKDAEYYDLMGRKRNMPSKGFYIKNGEKIIIK